MNPKMFNSFLDGTKSALEMAAIAVKRNLKKGEWLDGEGGERVFGKLMPAKASLALKSLRLDWRTM
jgi:predicted homoserine dehydrogenase-like protein